MLGFSGMGASSTMAATFHDLPESHWAEDEVDYLTENGIVAGYTNGNFGVKDAITRAQAAVILTRELNLNQASESFSDVPSSHWAAGSIGALANAGIINGYPNGTFKPEEPITRAEMAIVLDGAYKLSGNDRTTFSDLRSTHWSYNEVQDLAANKIIAGFPDQTFRPNKVTTREEFGVFLARILNESFTPVVTNPTDVTVLVNKERSLPSTYAPSNLTIPNDYWSTSERMRQVAADAFNSMYTAARQDGHQLIAISGYRSYERQKQIFQANVEEYGFERANQFSAQPGESEHQTGLVMDVSSPELSSGDYLSIEFAQTSEGRWVRNNASDYGFIIRYPEGKESITGYQYEPWHLRYVGTEPAQYIDRYNLTLEEYLGTE